MPNKKRSIFYPYHPFATFANKDDRNFVDANGELVMKGWMRNHEPADNPDIAAIFDVAEDAFERLTQDPYDGEHSYKHFISSPEDFDNAVIGQYVDVIDDLMDSLMERIKEGSVKVSAKHGGQDIQPEDMADSSNPWKVRLLWHFLGYMEDRSEIAPLFRTLFLVATLEAVGDVLVSMCLDGRGQAEASSGMHDCYYTALAIEAEYRTGKRVKQQIAKQAAAARLAKDPRQAEKMFILECWQAWKAGTHQYKSKAAFARDMIEKCEHLTSTKKVEDWCREWEKEHSPS